MPSISYKVTEKLFAHTVKAIMGGSSKEDFIDFVYSMAMKRELEVPFENWQKKYNYRELELGDMTVIKIAAKDKEPDGILLYFTGDGLYMPPSAADFELCADIAVNTGLDVWMVSYPLIPRAKPQEIIETSLDIYKRALEEFPPEKISFMGLSSGCLVAMGICFYLREKGLDMPLPSGFLLQSPPLCSPPTPDQLTRMLEIEKKDVTVTVDYFKYLASVTSFMGFEYLVRPMKYDMTGFPPIDIFYGTKEMAIAYLDDFKQKCSDEGLKLGVHIGQDMMRSWCLLTQTPEAKAVRKEYYNILNK